jgi:hypothetical protein
MQAYAERYIFFEVKMTGAQGVHVVQALCACGRRSHEENGLPLSRVDVHHCTPLALCSTSMADVAAAVMVAKPSGEATECEMVSGKQ